MSTHVIPTPQETLGTTIPPAIQMDEYLSMLVKAWAVVPSRPGQHGLLDDAFLRYLTPLGDDVVHAYRWVGDLVRIAHAAASSACVDEAAPVHVGFLGIGMRPNPVTSETVDLRIAPFFVGPLVERRVALTAFLTTATALYQQPDLCPSQRGFVQMVQTLAIPTPVGEARKTLVVRDTLVMVEAITEQQQQIFEHLLQGDPILPQDHASVFLDLARQGRETEFKDLARMILDRLSPEDIDVMWTGTIRRLRRESDHVPQPTHP